jgi:hypothetical protein
MTIHGSTGSDSSGVSLFNQPGVWPMLPEEREIAYWLIIRVWISQTAGMPEAPDLDPPLNPKEKSDG